MESVKITLNYKRMSVPVSMTQAWMFGKLLHHGKRQVHILIIHFDLECPSVQCARNQCQ